MNRLCLIIFPAVAAMLSACASSDSAEPFFPPATLSMTSMPPPAAREFATAGLGPCTDEPDRTLRIRPGEQVMVLVHGWRGTPGSLRGLAQRLAQRGHQTVCFSYNDRDSLMVSSGKLAADLDHLAATTDGAGITVLGHSQGALVARKALVGEHPHGLRGHHADLRLVTMSGPFGGIAAAAHCTSPLARVLTLGMSSAICHAIAGDKWPEITFRSDFIRQPGTLHPSVREHLKIETDEKGSCRRFDGKSCRESDFIFTLAEQRNAAIDNDARTRMVTVEAGHVEIVGNSYRAPPKLIAVLEENRVLPPAVGTTHTTPVPIAATARSGVVGKLP